MNLFNSHTRNRLGNLIAVEGCIGVGKTTWANALAKTRLSQLSLENFEDNPFLQSFYEDPQGNALETELHFLLIHYHQLKNIQNKNATETVTDFTFVKDSIFAKLNILKANEIQAFTQLYTYLLGQLRPMDLVIYIRGSNETILKRIKNRKRPDEMKIDDDYYIRLNQAYEHFFNQYSGAVLVIDANRTDCMENPEAVLDVSGKIDKMLALSTPNGHSRIEIAT